MIKIKDGTYINPNRIRVIEPWIEWGPTPQRVRGLEVDPGSQVTVGTMVVYESGASISIRGVLPDEVFTKIQTQF